MNTLGKAVGTVFLGSVLLCWSGLSWGADWALYYEDGMEMHHYDKATIERPRKGIIQISIKTTELGTQIGKTRRLEMSCHDHTYRNLSDKVDPITGKLIPEGAESGYKWTWIPMESRMDALYENLCE